MKKSDIRQNKIVEEFKILESDLEMSLNYLMEMGTKLDSMDNKHRKDENLVKDCQSKVWLLAKNSSKNVHFEGDSNTSITKGLLALLIRVFSNLSSKEIIETKIFFPKRIGLDRFIGTQRSNGFASMEKKIKYLALTSVKTHE